MKVIKNNIDTIQSKQSIKNKKTAEFLQQFYTYVLKKKLIQLKSHTNISCNFNLTNG